MSDVFAFIDETGVLGPGSQRFYGLGLLKLEDTAPLTEAVHRTYQRVRGRLGRTSVGFELKFNTSRPAPSGSRASARSMRRWRHRWRRRANASAPDPADPYPASRGTSNGRMIVDWRAPSLWACHGLAILELDFRPQLGIREMVSPYILDEVDLVSEHAAPLFTPTCARVLQVANDTDDPDPPAELVAYHPHSGSCRSESSETTTATS